MKFNIGDMVTFYDERLSYDECYEVYDVDYDGFGGFDAD